MTKPTTDTFGHFKIYVGDGSSPEVFEFPCGFTQQALTITTTDSQTTLADCDDPEAPQWTEAAGTSVSGKVDGSGVLAEESDDIWLAWAASGLAKHIRIARRGGYWSGSALLLSYGESVQLGSEGNRIQRQVSLRNAGAWTYTAGAVPA